MDIRDEDILQAREISINFEDHKNGDNMDKNTQEDTGRPGSTVVLKLLQIPRTTLDTPIHKNI